MTIYSFTRYLAAKKSVDDRALNRNVWAALERVMSAPALSLPLKVLEIGAGIGTMVERMLSWDLLARADYVALDSRRDNLLEAEVRLTQWGKEHGYRTSATGTGGLSLERGDRRVELEFVPLDLFTYLDQVSSDRRWDLLVANAFLDLVDIHSTLPKLFAVLPEGGYCYFSLNFDGVTILEPLIDPEFDDLVLTLYHQTMDERIVDGRQSGDSRTGRHLFAALNQAGAQILEAGSSDWVVYPGEKGYPEDEAYFLHYIIHTIHQALRGHPRLQGERFPAWVAERHNQIEQGELIYIAHQMDFLGRFLGGTRPGGSASAGMR